MEGCGCFSFFISTCSSILWSYICCKTWICVVSIWWGKIHVTDMISSIRNLIYELPHKLSNKLIKTWEFRGKLAKSQIWMVAQPSVQSLRQNLFFLTCAKKYTKTAEIIFFILSYLAWVINFSQNILQRIVHIFYCQTIPWNNSCTI